MEAVLQDEITIASEIIKACKALLKRYEELIRDNR